MRNLLSFDLAHVAMLLFDRLIIHFVVSLLFFTLVLTSCRAIGHF